MAPGQSPILFKGFIRFLFPQQTHGFTGAPFICLFLCVPLMISILFSCILKMFFYNFAPEIQNDGLKTRLYDNKRCTETGSSHVWERWKWPKRLIISAFMRFFWHKMLYISWIFSKFAVITGAELRLQLVFFSLTNLQHFLQTSVILIVKLN